MVVVQSCLTGDDAPLSGMEIAVPGCGNSMELDSELPTSEEGDKEPRTSGEMPAALANSGSPSSAEDCHSGGKVQPNINDVILGNSMEASQHEGNERFRSLVRLRRLDYMAAKSKFRFSAKIISEIRSRSPPGRFLKAVPPAQEGGEVLYYDVGDWHALHKVASYVKKVFANVSGGACSQPDWNRDALFVANDLINWDVHRLQKLLHWQDWRHVGASTETVALKIVGAIRARQGRFFERRDGVWYPLGPRHATRNVHRTLFYYLLGRSSARRDSHLFSRPPVVVKSSSSFGRSSFLYSNGAVKTSKLQSSSVIPPLPPYSEHSNFMHHRLTLRPQTYSLHEAQKISSYIPINCHSGASVPPTQVIRVKSATVESEKAPSREHKPTIPDPCLPTIPDPCSLETPQSILYTKNDDMKGVGHDDNHRGFMLLGTTRQYHADEFINLCYSKEDSSSDDDNNDDIGDIIETMSSL